MSNLDTLIHGLTVMMGDQGYTFVSGLPDRQVLEPWRVLQPDCLLPVFLRLGEELWRSETNGAGFGLRFEEDKHSLTGFRVTGLFHVPLSIAMLAIDAVFAQVAAGDGQITLAAVVHQIQAATA